MVDITPQIIAIATRKFLSVCDEMMARAGGERRNAAIGKFSMRALTVALVLVFGRTPSVALDRSPWQAPIVSETPDGTELRIDKAPAGLFLRETLDPTKRYRLEVIGSGELITMRLQIDDRPHEYLPAPEGSAERVITGASRIELLFYADKPATYSLKVAEVKECPLCRTLEDLRQRILKEAPEAISATGLEKAVALMKWAANVADYTPNPDLVPRDFENWPPDKAVYEFFDLDKGGVFCGGHAVFLRRILHMFNIDAFTINFGLPNLTGDPRKDLTHVTVIVPFQGRFYILDPHFAVTFRAGGQPLEIEQGIDAVNGGQSQLIEAVEHGLQRRDLVGVTSEIEDFCTERRTTSSGLAVCKMGNNSHVELFRHLYEPTWEAAGIPLGNATIFRLMTKGFFNVGPSLDPTHREGFLVMLKKHGILFHSF